MWQHHRLAPEVSTTPRAAKALADWVGQRNRGGVLRLIVKQVALLAGITILAATPACGAEGAPQQRGLALPTLARGGYESASVSADLGEIASIGADWVQINPTWYQEDTHTSEIGSGAETPDDASVERAIQLAHQIGLQVFLKPHVDLIDGTYRGTIQPDNRAAWFSSYDSFITRYADIAARTKVELFAVGTELAGTSSDRDSWLEVVKNVRAHYQGPIVYAANFDEYHAVSFWDVLDLIGIDAYWQLSDEPTTDQTKLKQAWQPICDALQKFAAQTGRRVLFTEAGYTSQRGTTTKPSSWTISQVPDQAEQAVAYQALLSTFQNQSWWAGVYWWYWSRPLDQHPDDPLGYSPHGKEAEKVLRQAWGQTR